MVVAIGVVHPQGENDNYDGLFFKQNEMEQLSQDLVDLPLCIEHLDEHVVGKVLHSWVSSEKSRPECFVMFETDDTDIRGNVAANLITQGYCCDLSLGHECKVDSSTLSVVSKTPKEVSICTQGARQRTHIYGYQNKKNSEKYINIKALASKQTATQPSPTFFTLTIKSSTHTHIPAQTTNTMSLDSSSIAVDAPAEGAAAAAPAAPVAPAPSLDDAGSVDTNVVGELMSQLQALREQNKQLAEQNQDHQKIGKRKREAAVDGSIREMITKLYDQYESLGLHKDELNQQLEAMKSSSNADGIVEMLSCVAAQHSSSVVELEKALQERKKLAEENKRLKTQITRFADPAERTVETVNAVASKGRTGSAAAAPNQFDSIFGGVAASAPAVGKSRGMQELYPNLFDNLVSSAGSSATGMQKFGSNDTKFFNQKMSNPKLEGGGFQAHSFQ